MDQSGSTSEKLIAHARRVSQSGESVSQQVAKWRVKSPGRRASL